MSDTHTIHTDSEKLIRLLDAAENAPDAVALRNRGYQLLRVRPGATVVDVGCGAGRAVAELAQQGARAIGVDPDAAMLAAARNRFPGIDVRAGNATDLPLDDGRAQGYRADKVYHMLPEPAAALAEARRVLAPGGRIVLVGQDWEAVIIDSDQPDLTRRIVQARADTVPQPRIARAYRNLLLDGGFQDVEVEVHTAILTDATAHQLLTRYAEAARRTGAISAEQAEAWLGEQNRRAASGRLIVAAPMFLAAATR
ncbi:methyltransferase domain-containing protein [Micromonospora sp. HM5-17]|jgi:ubiquinone/menaquinone biosynthesis C-methylase UbiE|uniref:methyltransferase domain-containing protein n=1 Tax=Micromonospora sp. HM5-17 TaxID=2487710 RepID=UPI000F47BCA6|nr:methyltransferase domain-containing protein [Micromonospora sp. HM5-17]ROT33114.1 methyltransferase domain-containing protein [Micromonospora sp. HM5-17]